MAPLTHNAAIARRCRTVVPNPVPILTAKVNIC
jgi:hypothetical protein